MPRSSRVPLGYGHFFRPPGEVSLFCPGAHLPEGVRSGLPFPGPSFIAANATSAATNNVIRFLILSHPLSLIVLDTIGPRRDARWAEAQAKAPPLLLCEGVGLSL